MLEAITKSIRRFKTVIQREISYYSLQPREVNIELTHRCNLRCKMCGVWTKGVDPKLKEIDVNEYLDIFSQLKDLGVKLVTLAGGEPFIRRDLFDIVKAAKSQGLKCNIFTNGTLISNLAVKGIFNHKIDKLIFSIDGFGAIHDSIRGVPGAFDKAMGALHDILDERKAQRIKKPEIDIHLTLLKDNIEDLSKLNDFCEKIGVNLSFQPYSESDEQVNEQTCFESVSIGSNRYVPHGETLRFSKENVSQIKKELMKIPVTFYTKLLSSFSTEDFRYGVMPVKKCYITRNFMMIDPYGNVFPCTNLDAYIAGNVRELSLSKIWHGNRYAALRKNLSKSLLPVCTYCCHCADNLNIVQLMRIVLKGN